MTPSEEMFVKEYLIDLNATRACIRAGYNPRSARTQGSRLLRDNPEIVKAVQAEMDRRAKKTRITAERVLEGIARIADAAERAEKYNEALKAFELLGKHLKLFTDKIELSGTVSLAERLKAARERSK